MFNHHPARVRVTLSSNRTTIMVGRVSLVHVSIKQGVKGQARVKLGGYFFNNKIKIT